MRQGASSPRPRPSSSTLSKPVEIWGGIECTVNRVGDRYYDQIALSGHDRRIVEDLERFAELGLRTLRYPVLWERVAPNSLDDADWSATDIALDKMRELRIRPILGFVHHGSGPRHTSLLDPHFKSKLCVFARAVAERYPWVDMYTPINEPLTTARFATLYGLWYPHARDDRSFARAVINQCAAIRESMAGVRSINSDAQLVQTEDLGTTYSTPALAYQATFENNRRWLTFDLLSGRLDEWHPLWWYLLESGITRQELESFLTSPCVPDIIGINHYLTSDRYLDDRVELYPEHVRGGNGRHSYADVEAVRTTDEEIRGHLGVLRDAWERYALPMAITEVHLGCTREEQLRWLNEAWSATNRLRADGVGVRALTVWSLLGSHGWSSLLTDGFDTYESAAFDLRSPGPRATAVAMMTRGLATTGAWDHPALDGEGWWRRESRFMYLPRSRQAQTTNASATSNAPRVILITGAQGTLGRAFQRIARERGLAFRALGRSELDICGARAVAQLLSEVGPWAVINAAGFVRVDEAEDHAVSCFSSNTEGPSVLAYECARLGIQFATFSSDLVFDGNKGAPYVESDAVSPLNNYGASKARQEEQVGRWPSSLVIRTSAFFGPWDSHNFLATTFHEVSQGRSVRVANDTVISATYVPDLVNTTLDLIIDGERGIWHLTNEGAVTWYEFALAAAERAGIDHSLIVGCPMRDLGLRAKRPISSALRSERGTLMPRLEEAIDQWVAAVRSSQLQPRVRETSSSV